MIGLGSNRLTIARRGGMSVTQAGKGGMEWLGVRYPSWATPYSAAATAALVAQFPTQWPTIRDYGFAHPEIVPWVNDNPLRWGYIIANYTANLTTFLADYQRCEYIQSTGTQYILHKGVNTNNDWNIEMDVCVVEYGASWTPLCINHYVGGVWIGAKAAQMVLRQYSGNDYILFARPAAGEFFNLKVSSRSNAASYYINNELKGSASNATFTFNAQQTNALLSDKGGTNAKAKLAFYQSDEECMVACYLKNGGTIGMYDFVTGTLKTNSGTGTFGKGADVN